MSAYILLSSLNEFREQVNSVPIRNLIFFNVLTRFDQKKIVLYPDTPHPFS
jgi:hypothetical protein